MLKWFWHYYPNQDIPTKNGINLPYIKRYVIVGYYKYYNNYLKDSYWNPVVFERKYYKLIPLIYWTINM